MNIFGDDSEKNVTLTINKKYAENYDKWRRGEELQKLKDKYGDSRNYETDPETSSSEDENAKALTKEIEKSFFKTLSSLKEKHPKIYDRSTQFFGGEQEKTPKTKQKPEEKSYFYSIAEYQRSVLVDRKGKLSDEEGERLKPRPLKNKCELKKSFKDVLNEPENENDEDEWGGLFKKRTKTQKEINIEEEDYKKWLAGEKEKLTNKHEEKEFKGLHDYWNNPGLDDKEIFLRDYILNKRFLSQNNKKRIPTYDEIICESDLDLAADENTLRQQDEFEKKYNFRFEEPDQDFIKRYPRTMEHSMRKKDEKRKKKREDLKKRREADKAKKAEELKRLKALKKKEILEKIKKLQQITGNSGVTFQKNDLEGDFNPAEHDQRMSELFNENYYGSCSDEKKPECPELDAELEIENWDNWNEKVVGEEEEDENENDNLHCEDPNFNMDCDYDPTKKMLSKNFERSFKKNKRKQSRFAAAIAKEKPLFDPSDKTFEKYVDEYYSLDYEDLIGDLPCRFKYRKVVPNDFGLSIEEILAAPDKELNSWVSVKKIMQRRPQNVELYDVQAYKKKAKDINKKRKCLPSLFETFNGDNSEKTTPNDEADKKQLNNTTKKKFQNYKFKESRKLSHSEMKKESQNLNLNLKKNDEKWTSNHQKKLVNSISNVRLKSYGINPKKLKNKLKYK